MKKINPLTQKEHLRTWDLRKVIFLDWEQLYHLLKRRITSLIDRDINPVPFQDGDYWDVQTETYTAEELEKILCAANADEEDRENNDADLDGRIYGLTAVLAMKLISPELPFVAEKTVAVESGVYFFSEREEFIKHWNDGKEI